MTPDLDYHTLAPEIVLTGDDRRRAARRLVRRAQGRVPRIASIGVLAALIPVLTLAADGADRSMFDGAYVVDNYALVFKGLFLVVGLRHAAAVVRLHRRGRLLPG